MSKVVSTKNFTSEDFKTFIIDNLTNCKTVELIVLKGHVLIEYMLNHFIDKATNDDTNFENGRFSFSQKNYILELLGEKIKDLHEEINLINKLRNDIAHRLTYNEKHLSTLLSQVGKKYPKIIELRKEKHLMLALAGAITFICGRLYGQIEAQNKRKQIFKDFVNFTKQEKEGIQK